MKTHSGSTSEGFNPAMLSANTGSGTAVAPAPEDPTATFADYLHQEDAGSATPRGGTPFANALANVAPVPATTPAAAGATALVTSNAGAAAPGNAVTSGTAGSWAFNRTAGAPTLPATAPAQSTVALPTTKAASLKIKSPATTQPLPEATVDDPTGTAPNGGTSASGTKTFLASSDLSMMLARSAMLAANARQASTPDAATTASPTASETLVTDDAGASDVSLSAWSAQPVGLPAPEKKSAAAASQRSFIQAPPPAESTLTLALLAPFSPAQTFTQSTNNQLLTTTPATTLASPGSSAATALTSAGMASGKKEPEMNATLELSDLMVSTGTTPEVTHGSADVQILLGTNNDFKDALAQVMHVAELSNLSATTPPLRVAIEIQTPPGAVVNLYVSKQPDNTYRAQLSTDDVQALHWVQQQIGSLKESTETGVEVRWLPAQLESAPASSSSGNSQNDSAWNRGGQGWQSSQDQQEQANQRRQKRGGYTDVSTRELSLPFLSALGRAA
jgi:hypothetical protein